MIKSLNRPDIAKSFAKDLNLTYKQTEEIVAEIEKTVLRFLKERSQVRIHGFGTFYVATMKSHVIKQIRTKTPRIILQQKKIKFRPSPTFKDAIHQRVRKPASIKKIEKEADTIITVEPIAKASPVKAEPVKPTEPAIKPVVEFKPFSAHPRVEKESMRQKITERWLKMARNETKPKPQTEVARETIIVGNLLSQIKKAGYATVNFVFSGDKIINIFAGRPRRQLSHLPKEIISGFLDYVDIKEFNIPQERRIALTLNQARGEKIYLHIHSFPIESGASIQITIS
jgi:nucleoid DNA-binding protein